MSEFAFIPGESFNGAIARWADEHDQESMVDITSHAGVAYGHRQYAPQATTQQIEKLAGVMGVEASELLARATPRTSSSTYSRYDRHLFHGVAIPSYLLEKNSRRYAPGGLASSVADERVGTAYDRAVWQVRAFPFCTESWQLLLDRCPGCQKHPAWQHTLGIDRCEHCMTDLKTAEAEAVPAELRASLAAAAGLVDHDAARRAEALALLPERISRTGASVALDLLVNLMPVVDPTLSTDPTKLFTTPGMRICRAISEAWKVMADWPDAMSALASAKIATRTGRHNDGNRGRTSRFLNPKWNKGISPEVQKLIADWRAAVDVNGPNRDAILLCTRSVTDAATLIRMGSQDIVALRRRNAFPAIFALDHGRPEPRFSVEIVQNISDLIRARMSTGAAQLAIGVSCQGIEQLVAMRLLDQEDHSILMMRYGVVQIAASSVSRLERRLAAGADGDPENCTLPLRSAMKAIGGRLKPWGPAFRSLVDLDPVTRGKLRYVLSSDEGPLTRRILIDPTDLPQVCNLWFDEHDSSFRQIPYSTTMSKIDAGEVLNLGFSRSLPLLSDFSTPVGSHEKLVPVAHVLDLARRHISVSELAVRRGVSLKRAWSDATKASVRNLGPGGFCRKQGEQHLLAIIQTGIGLG